MGCLRALGWPPAKFADGTWASALSGKQRPDWLSHLAQDWGRERNRAHIIGLTGSFPCGDLAIWPKSPFTPSHPFMNVYRRILPFLVVSGTLAWVSSVQAQVRVTVKMSKSQYVAHEPVLATVTVTNNVGRDLLIHSEGVGRGTISWLDFVVTSGRNSLRPRTKLSFKSVTIPAGRSISKTIDLTGLYRVTEAGNFPIDGHGTRSIPSLQVEQGALHGDEGTRDFQRASRRSKQPLSSGVPAIDSQCLAEVLALCARHRCAHGPDPAGLPNGGSHHLSEAEGQGGSE